MSNTKRRHALFEDARRALGAESAETLMDHLPEDRDQLATTTDIRLVKADISVLGSQLRAEMAQLGGDLRSEMAQLGGDLRSEMAQLGGDLRSEMAQQTRLLMITMLTTTVTIVLAVLGAALAA
ncbi:hypothetical protein ACE2AJ_18780 [Aquihabitans daechungensis]|uniref:hypothetical protein n=1 Tax=Aquihabitans daechungensis TaxID=1052257 RepID=UPI003BA0A91B